MLPSHQASPAPLRVSRRRFRILDDEPSGENARSDWGELCTILLMPRRRVEFKTHHIEKIAKFGNQARFFDFVTPIMRPVPQTRHDYRIIRQVNHRPWSVGRDQLALTNEIVGHRISLIKVLSFGRFEPKE